MEMTDMQHILRCGQCNKPFDKESTLKRHGYYCRSRKLGSSTRYRSCISCARGKARCDTKRPKCSRCLTKGIECHYPSNTPKASRTKQQNVESTSIESASPSVFDSPLIEIRRDGILDSDTTPADTFGIPDPEFGDMEGKNLGWGDPNLDFASFLNLQTNDEIAQYPSWGSSFATHPADQTFLLQQPIAPKSLIPELTWNNSTNQIAELLQPTPPSKSMIPMTVPTLSNRSLIFRPRMEPSTQRIATLILHTLKSYPLMISLHNSLPPFIHPSLVAPNVENTDMELLNNCLNLVHMTGSKVQGSRKLFWKNVRLECEFMLQEHTRLKRWQLLAALQALSIYILMRLNEGETDHNDFDPLLIRAVIAISQQFTPSRTTCEHCNQRSIHCTCNLQISWADWIFQESARRMCTIYQVMNMLVYFEPAAMCEMENSEIILAPLPSKKHLWEATSAQAWKAEMEKEAVGGVKDFGLASNGDLVRLDDGRLTCEDYRVVRKGEGLRRRAESWEEWCAGMDGFGGLVMLAASMIV